jgi:hypothetical protein
MYEVCIVRGGAIVFPYSGGISASPEFFFFSLLAGNAYCCPECGLPSDASLMDNCFEDGDAACERTGGLLLFSFEKSFCCPNPNYNPKGPGHKLKQAPLGLLGRALQSLQKEEQHALEQLKNKKGQKVDSGSI